MISTTKRVRNGYVPAPPVRALLEQLLAARTLVWVSRQLRKDPTNLLRAAKGHETPRAFAEAVEALAREVFDDNGQPRELPAKPRPKLRRRPQGTPVAHLSCAISVELDDAVRAMAQERNVAIGVVVEELLQATLLAGSGDEEQAA